MLDCSRSYQHYGLAHLVVALHATQFKGLQILIEWKDREKSDVDQYQKNGTLF